jgi:hypothetical protein
MQLNQRPNLVSSAASDGMPSEANHELERSRGKLNPSRLPVANSALCSTRGLPAKLQRAQKGALRIICQASFLVRALAALPKVLLLTLPETIDLEDWRAPLLDALAMVAQSARNGSTGKLEAGICADVRASRDVQFANARHNFLRRILING